MANTDSDLFKVQLHAVIHGFDDLKELLTATAAMAENDKQQHLLETVLPDLISVASAMVRKQLKDGNS